VSAEFRPLKRPPGPPPPKSGARGRAPGGKAPPPKSASHRAQSEEPWFSGRRLQWRELLGAGDARHSIFDQEGGAPGLASGFNWNELDELFGSRKLNAAIQRRASTGVLDAAPSRGRDDAGVLSHRQATCCGIVLQKVGDVSILCKRLRAVEALAEDDAQRLQELVDLVEGKQAEQLREVAARAEAGGRPLRALEKQLLPLVQLDHARARLRLVQVAGSLEAQRESICSNAGSLEAAAKGACTSTALKDLVRAAMSLRNYVQRGPEALHSAVPAPRVMDIGSLLSSMREFKAVDSGARRVSLLCFFATSLLRMRPDFDAQLQAQLPGLGSLARLPWKGLADGLAQLRADAAFVATELRDSAAAYGAPGGPELDRLTALAASAQAAVDIAAGALDSAQAALVELGRYFGVRGAGCDAGAPAADAPRKEPSGLTVLGQLAELLAGFRVACEEVRMQQREEASEGKILLGSSCLAPGDKRRTSPSPCRATFTVPAAA